MKFLQIIASPFIKLWTWIKETAWVQPLLIVGCIFAVIFSIPYIVRGIQNISTDEENNMQYYEDHSLSMMGAYHREGDAYNFLTAYQDVQNSFETYKNTESTEEEKTTAKTEIDEFVDTYGDKFFFTLSKDDCEACDQMSEAFEYLQNNASDLNVEGFDLKTIIVDQDMGDESDRYEEISAFESLYNSTSGAFDEFYLAGLRGSYYSASSSIDYDTLKTNCNTLVASDVSSMQVPLIVLIDLSTNESEEFNNLSPYVASQVFFSVDGDTASNRALQLADAWNYNGKIFGYNQSNNNYTA